MKSTFLFIAGAILTLMVGWPLHNASMEENGYREFARGQLVWALTIEQMDYAGPRDQNGCYMLPRRENHQFLIDTYQFTSYELERTFNELFCWGGIIPANS